MNPTQYTVLFKPKDVEQFEIIIYAFGFIQALIKGMNIAIENAQPYQPYSITNNINGTIKLVDDVAKLGKLLK